MVKYGEVVYLFQGYFKRIVISFRYRYDSVPGVHKLIGSYFKAWYKTPKTINEKKAWYASEGYGRRKRSPTHLPNPWNDFPRADRYYDKSWKKNKIRRQWMKSL